MIKLKDITKCYDTADVRFTALNNVNLNINDGEHVAIIGESGAGKTTLLNIISTLDKPTSGLAEYNGRNIGALSEKDAAWLRLHEFGFVFQDHMLMPMLNVWDNICMPLVLSGRKIDTPKIHKLAERILPDCRLEAMPHQLSGGQQQRVGIARAVVTEPAVIFADEPTGNLDSVNSLNVMSVLLETSALNHSTLIYVTHNEELAQKADRIITIKDGNIIE